MWVIPLPLYLFDTKYVDFFFPCYSFWKAVENKQKNCTYQVSVCHVFSCNQLPGWSIFLFQLYLSICLTISLYFIELLDFSIQVQRKWSPIKLLFSGTTLRFFYATFVMCLSFCLTHILIKLFVFLWCNVYRLNS